MGSLGYRQEEPHGDIPDLMEMSNSTENPQEAGYPGPQPKERAPWPEMGPPSRHLPPGGGKDLVPHYTSFSALVNYFTRQYRYTFDEATKHSRAYTLAIRNEPVVMDAVRSLQIPACMLSWHLDPEDSDDPFQVVNAQGLERIVRRIPRFQQYRRVLLEGCFYGRYGIQNTFAWDWRYGQRNMVVRKWTPVNGDKLVFRYNGQVGILVHATWNQGKTSITDRGRAYFLSPEEREAFVLHEFEPEDSDFFEGDLAGAIHGVGWRGRIYWIYWLRAQVLGWLMEYLERIGAGGLTIYYYEAGNTESMNEVKAAAESQLGNNCLLFPRYRDAKSVGPGIERVDPSNSGVVLVRDLVIEYFDNIIRHYIMGETLSAVAAPTGLGSGVAELHGNTKGERIKYVSTDLDETLGTDLISTLNRYNCRGNPCPRFTSEVEKPNVAEYMDGVNQFVTLGGMIDAEKTREILALPGPRMGKPILGAPQPVAPGEGGEEEGSGNEEGPPQQMSRRARSMSKKLARQVRDHTVKTWGPRMRDSLGL